MAPTYSRVRHGAADWPHRGGHWAGAYSYGFIAPYFSPPLVAQSWYERPYPYHFDYYRYRWARGAIPNVDARLNECPCAVPAEAEVTQ